MTHYVCRGECSGVSDVPKSCGAETCSRHGMPLEVCGCTDNRHGKDEKNGNAEKKKEK